MPGFEPATYRLQGGCSTTELKRQYYYFISSAMTTAIPKITKAASIAIHSGDSTHHQLHVIVPISLWCINSRVSKPKKPVPVPTYLVLSVLFAILLPILVPPAGLEPALHRNEILSLARLPISPRGQYCFIWPALYSPLRSLYYLCLHRRAMQSLQHLQFCVNSQ